MLRREFMAGLGMLSLAGSGMARAAVKNPLPAGGVTMKESGYVAMRVEESDRGRGLGL